MSYDLSPAELESDFAAVARVVSGSGSQTAAVTTLLHIGDEHLVVLSGRGEKPESVHRLDLGAARIARDFYRHDPPTSQEIERAIDFAEDEIMRLGKPADVAATLWSTSAVLQAWGAVSSHQSYPSLFCLNGWGRTVRPLPLTVVPNLQVYARVVG